MANKHFNLTYALKDNKITYIEDVERGLKCNCVCPACGEKLIARKGNKVSHHFAHQAKTNCEYGYQTSLHLAAKDIILNSKYITLPTPILSFENSSKQVIIPGDTKLVPDNVELERNFGEIIPDIVVYKNTKKLFIEIYVTHKIDDEKLKKLKHAGISTIEIDLSKVDHSISREELTEILLNDSPQKKWVYNKKYTYWREKFYEKADKMKVINRDLASHVDWCPMSARTYKGKPYANVMDDCFYCQYNIGEVINNDDELKYIYCTGRQRISEICDFKRSLQEEQRIEEENKRYDVMKQRYCERSRELVKKEICPDCGQKLVLKEGRYGKFLGCSNFPKCRYKHGAR